MLNIASFSCNKGFQNYMTFNIDGAPKYLISEDFFAHAQPWPENIKFYYILRALIETWLNLCSWHFRVQVSLVKSSTFAA